MAIQKRNLKKEYTLDEPKQYVVYNEGAKVGKFSAVAGATATDTKLEDDANGDIYPQLLPLMFDDATNSWEVVDDAGTIEGFLLGAVGISATSAGNSDVVGRLQVSTTDEVLGVVLTKGAVRASDVFLPAGLTGGQSALDDKLAGGSLRMLGIDVLGLEGVH